MGNPTTYKNEDLQWSYGRNLRRYGNNIFEYGADNIRYKKNNTVYTLDGSTILKGTDGTKTITYYYGNGGVIGFNYNGNEFNLYENNWDFTDVNMWIDTGIDTVIGVGSYYLAAGTMSLVTTGALVAFGWNIPGLVVVGGVVVLSIAYDALIRWITGYDK